MKKALLFDDNDKETLEFLDSCGRKQAKITSLAIKEFISKYQLKDKSPEELRVFLNSYEYIKAATDSMAFSAYAFSNKPSIIEENKSRNQVDDVKENINKMAALFGA